LSGLSLAITRPCARAARRRRRAVRRAQHHHAGQNRRPADWSRAGQILRML